MQTTHVKAGKQKSVCLTLIFHPFSAITCFSFSLFDVHCWFAFHLFLCCFAAWVSATLIETHSVFVFTLSLPPLPLSSTLWRAASQSKAQKKLQPLTQVPVLQEQGEYCAGAGGVWTWVPAVWSGVGGMWGLHPFLSMPSFFLSTSIFWLTSKGGWSVGSALIPLSPSQREAPHTEPTQGPKCGGGWGGGSLWCVSEHLSLGFRGVSGCVRVFSAALTHTLSKHCEACLRISHDQFFSLSLTHNEKNLINSTPFKLNRSKSHFNGIGLV